MFRLSLKMTMRDWRAGELHFLLAALALAVAAIASVNFFTDRLGTAISRNAHHMLGADLLLSSGKPLAPSWQDTARKAGLASAQTVILSSMASNGAPGAPMQLVELKAVGPGYPLRGALRLAGGAASAHGGAAPAPGTAWIDPALMAQLHLAPGQAIKVGDLRMRVADVIVSEPDRGLSPILLPRVMIALTDLAASGLLQDGARAHYQLLLAGEAPALSATAAAFKASLAQSRRKDVRMASIESMQSDMGGALTQAGQFFSLVSLLTAMLAALAVAMAARRFMLRHADACAVLRCLGLRQAQLARLFLYEFLLVGAAATGVGLLCGYAGHFVLLECMAGVLRMEMPPPSALPALFSGATGLLMLLGFALPPLLQLRDVAPIRVLRREHGAPPARAAFTYLPGALAFGALVLWQCGDAKLGLFTFAGFGAAAIIFAAAAALGLLALVPARAARLGPAWRFALTSLQRRRRATITQTAALALGLMALLLLSVVRTDLTAAWREAIPANAPTHWIMNIQSAQHDEVAARLRVFGEPTMYPDVRARLVLINGKPLSAFTFARGIATDIAERELDMTASAKPPPSSSISGGQWFKADAATPEVSIDAEVLAELKLALGDTLAFDVGARRINARITSTRKIDRRSRSSDFLFVVNPQAVAGLLQNWSAAVKVPASDTAFAGRMGEHFPNLSIFHIGTLLAQMQQLLAQVATAIEFLFLFTLAAGVLVLYAALASSQDERMRQSAILRALGASRRQLVRAQWIEFLLTGAMAGALAAAGACLASWALARFVFDLPWTMAPALLPLGVLAGCLCAVAGAWSGLRHVLNTPPLNSLRAA
ncbi:MAG: FtsX-like permease family protein [Pseudomonadota bacterium]